MKPLLDNIESEIIEIKISGKMKIRNNEVDDFRRELRELTKRYGCETERNHLPTLEWR